MYWGQKGVCITAIPAYFLYLYRSHEEMSGKILQTIIDDGHIKDDALDDIDMKRVQDLIMGSCPDHQAPSNAALPLNDKRFLFDIVANGRNSIDVDKYDYLARDSHYCNVKVSCDLQRLRQLTKVESPGLAIWLVASIAVMSCCPHPPPRGATPSLTPSVPSS